jgi:hypothetical protein
MPQALQILGVLLPTRRFPFIYSIRFSEINSGTVFCNFCPMA